MPAPRLSITVVLYRTERSLVERAVASLAQSVTLARGSQEISDATLYLVDNGPPEDLADAQRVSALFSGCGRVEVLRGHGNVGYGSANNLVLPLLDSQLHLVMNPDVELDPGAIAAAAAVLRADSSLGAVAPSVREDHATNGHLCKRYPSPWILFLRGFAPRFMRNRFAATLDAYEMRDLPGDRISVPIPLASGCFLLVRTELFRKLGGFDPRFFMYFEDYDLSLRIGREAPIAYAPQARIAHHGGEASRKGLRHIAWFTRSAWRFFTMHGWNLP